MAWDYYRDGERVRAAALLVIELVKPGQRMTDTQYRIRYACCGAEDEMSHKRIREREMKHRTKCPRCACRANGRQQAAINKGRKHHAPADYGVTLPQWPVPQSVVADFDSAAWDGGRKREKLGDIASVVRR